MKTAVEWLCENNYTLKRELELGNPSLIKLINQAKEMEKQQRINDIEFGHGISSNVNINHEAYFKLDK